MTDFCIRKVGKGDEDTLAYIQTESWKAAFKNIVPEELLIKCTDINKATKMYRKLLDDNKGNGYILEVERKPHCIAYWDKAGENDLSGYAELICIHSLPNKWHQGYGSKMMDKVLEDIKNARYSKVMLWVFTENRRAIAFYKSKGFQASSRIRSAFGSTEIMYVKAMD